MKPLFHKQIGNLSVKLSALIVVLVFLVNTLSGFFLIRIAYKAILENTHTHSSEVLHSYINSIDAFLDRIESATQSTAQYADLISNDPNSAYRLLEQLIQSCDYIHTVGIMFRENYYPAFGAEYAPMLSRIPGSDELQSANSIDLGFHYLGVSDEVNWLEGVLGRSVWSDPYISSQTSRFMSAYSVPLYDSDGQVFAVLCSQIELNQLETYIEGIKSKRLSTVYVISHSGNYICDNDTAEFLQGNIVNEAEKMDDSDVYELVNDIMDGREGMKSMVIPTHFFAYYAPITKADWSVVYAIPLNNVFDGPVTTAFRMVILGIIALILIFVLSSFVIFRVITPFTLNLQRVSETNASIERDLSIAAMLQRSMLPTRTYSGIEGVDVAGFLRPAKMVGGDLYDYSIWRGKLYFAIGDVSGKGVTAAMFMTEVITLMRSVYISESRPGHILNKLNQQLSLNNVGNMFCTLFVGVLDLVTGNLSYCNGGHNYPVVCRRNDDGTFKAEFLPSTGDSAIGIFDDETYSDNNIQLHPGDTFFLYTDGVTESEDVNRRLFGDDAMLSTVQSLSSSSPQEIIDGMLKAVETHSSGAEQSDDITMLAFRYSGTGKEVLTLTNDVSRTGELSDWVKGICVKYDIPSARWFNIQLAVEEAVVNVMNYAYPGQTGMPVIVTALPDEGTVCFTIEDEGIRFNPLETKEPDLDVPTEECPDGGLGVFLYRDLMHDVHYEYTGGRNVLSLVV